MDRFKTEQEARDSAAKLAKSDGKTRYVIESPSTATPPTPFRVDTLDAVPGSADRRLAIFHGPMPSPAPTPASKLPPIPPEDVFTTPQAAHAEAAKRSKELDQTFYVIDTSGGKATAFRVGLVGIANPLRAGESTQAEYSRGKQAGR